MAISFVGVAGSAADDDNTSFTITKPSGVQTGDFMIAVVASYPGPGGGQVTVTPPAGWTLYREAFVTGSASKPHQLSIMTRVAAAGDPGSWLGVYSGNQELEGRICVAYRGVAGIVDDGTSVAGSDTAYLTDTVTNPTNNNWGVVAAGYTSSTTNYALEVYVGLSLLTNRDSQTVTGDGLGGVGGEALEAGVWDFGGSISTGNKSVNVARDGSWSTSCSWIGILDASDTTSSGSLTASLPFPGVSVAASLGVTGTMAVTLPKPSMTAAGIASPPEGPLAVTVTPVMTVAASQQSQGSMSVVMPPVVSVAAETRKFGIRVITPELEDRTIVPLTGSDSLPAEGLLTQLFSDAETVGGDLFVVRLFVPEVSAFGTIAPASAFQATLPKPEVLFTGNSGEIYVVDYATPQLAADAASGKRLVFPSGQTYTATSLIIPANCYVVGNGSTLKYPDGSTTSSTHSDEILKVNGSGVTVDGLNFDGNAQTQSVWSQHRHCVRILGAFSNIVVKNCIMSNIIGDGVYINTQSNSNVEVFNNAFSSDNFNRNGVSVVTGTNINVHDNTFTSCTRDGMPGPIDIEPNNSTDILGDIFIHNNTIVGGSTAGVGTIPGIVYGGFANAGGNNIQIYDNDVSGTRFTVGLMCIGLNGGPFNLVTNLKFFNNSVHDIGTANKFGIGLNHYIGADVYGNTINGTQWGIYNYKACLGVTTPANTFIGVTTNITNDDPHCS